MKKTLPVLLTVLLLTACTLPTTPKSTPTPSNEQVLTQAAIAATPKPTLPAASPTPSIPPQPAVVTATPGPVTATATIKPPTATQTSVPNTSTPVIPSATPTATATRTATATALPTITAPPSDPRNTLGKATTTDPLDGSSRWVWPIDEDKFTKVDFKDGAMFLKPVSDLDGWRLANPFGGKTARDFYLEMTVSTDECAPADRFGMIVRIPNLKSPDQGYLFGINCDGAYSLRLWDGKVEPNGSMTNLVNWTVNAAIQKGPKKTNRLGVMVVGSRFSLYANGVLLKEVNNATFTDGYFGVFVGSKVENKLTIQISEMALWDLTK
ncbi:MAG TPA: hypothetical protein VIO61_06880 [Anaerolineaceae bacterium]